LLQYEGLEQEPYRWGEKVFVVLSLRLL